MFYQDNSVTMWRRSLLGTLEEKLISVLSIQKSYYLFSFCGQLVSMYLKIIQIIYGLRYDSYVHDSIFYVSRMIIPKVLGTLCSYSRLLTILPMYFFFSRVPPLGDCYDTPSRQRDSCAPTLSIPSEECLYKTILFTRYKFSWLFLILQWF